MDTFSTHTDSMTPLLLGKLVTPALMRAIRDQFQLDWTGIHGAPHWARVRHHGLIDLDPTSFKLLEKACIGHSNGEIEADIRVQVCWDADRLDLGRVGVYPDARRLCTEVAQQAHVIEAAWAWSNAKSAPATDSYASAPAMARRMRR